MATETKKTTFLRPDPRGAVLRVHVQPGARESSIIGPHGDALKIRVAAPATDNRANTALVAYLAERLGVAKRQIHLLRGNAGRTKEILVEGIGVPEIRERLQR